MFKKVSAPVVAAVSMVALSPSVFAAEATWDYSSLTSGIDFSSISVGVLAVAAALAAVYAGIKGARLVLGFLRS